MQRADLEPVARDELVASRRRFARTSRWRGESTSPATRSQRRDPASWTSRAWTRCVSEWALIAVFTLAAAQSARPDRASAVFAVR